MKSYLFILAGIILISLYFFSFSFTGNIADSEKMTDAEGVIEGGHIEQEKIETAAPISGTIQAVVKRVIDGDTVELENGERVRLLGIDTPERGQHLFKESTDFLKEEIEGKVVWLESDESDKDKYGRLLRYVFTAEDLVNLELVSLGLAKTLIISPNEKYSEPLLSAEENAKNEKLGIWEFEDHDIFCIGIFYLHYNAKGNDNDNLNDEFVMFRNSCTFPISMNDWILKDKAGKEFVFPGIEVENKSRITVHTGSGENNRTDIYWANNRAIWNNNGDSLFLWDSEGNIILNYTY